MEKRKIVCVEGELKGGEIFLEPGETVMVGREPRFSNLIFQDMTVSRKHCLIELDEQGAYYVTDYSECGVATDEGKTFENNQRTECPQGTVLHIGKAGTKIALK
jgi:predicted component of type VI protein secretion system